MIKFLMSFFSLLLIHSSMFAQNTILLENTTPDFSVDINSLLNEKTAAAGDINPLFEYVLKAFASDHLYSYSPSKAGTIEIKVPLFDRIIDWEYFDKIREDFLKDPKQLKAIYKAIIPNFVAQFKKMSPAEQKAYIATIKESINYTASFDLSKENADLEKIEKENKQFYRVKGTVKAFIYRRIANEEMSQKDCLYWLKKLYKDLSRQTSKTSSQEDAYYLKPIGRNKNFALGKIWGTESYILFEKKGDIFQIFALDEGLSATSRIGAINDGILALFKTKEGSFKLFFLKKEEKPLDLGIVNVKEEAKFSFVEFKNTDAWGVGNYISYKHEITAIYARNKDGKIEQQLISSENKLQSVFLFTFKSGESTLLYKSAALKGLASIKNPKKVYNGIDKSQYWVVDVQDQLYYFHQYKKKEPVLVTSGNPIKAIETINANKAIIQYEDGKSDFVLLDYNKNITRITLPKDLAITDIKQAWRITGNPLLYYITVESGMKGLMEENGKVILAPEYESINRNGKKAFITKDGKRGIADTDGKILLAPKYTRLTPFRFNNEDKAAYYKFSREKDGLIGLIEESGKVILQPIYTDFKTFKFSSKDKKHYFFFKTQKEGPTGLMDETGKVLLKPTYSFLRPFRINPTDKNFYAYFNTEEDKLKGLIDDTGRVIIPAKYAEMLLLKERPNLFIVRTTDNKKGIIDINGKVRLNLEYSYLDYVQTEDPKKTLFLFQKDSDDKKGIIDINKKVLISENFTVLDQVGAYMYNESWDPIPLYIGAKEDKGNNTKYALFSTSFKQLSDFIIDQRITIDTIVTFDPDTFEEIVRYVDNDDTYNVAMPLHLRYKQFFLQRSNKKAMLFDIKGKVIIPAIWDKIADANSLNYFRVAEGKKWGLLNRSNKVIIPASYKKISPCKAPFTGHYILESEDGSYNLADSTGKTIFAEPQGEILSYEGIPLLFVSKKVSDQSIKYAIYSKEAKALTGFEFSNVVDTAITFNNDTFEEMVYLKVNMVGANHDLEKRTITLFRDDKKVTYNFEGKEIK